MSSGTKIRSLSRLLDANDAPLWVIGTDGNLLYLSGAVADWLQVDINQLVGRRCVAGASISNDPLDYLAASLSPPPGFHDQGTASLRVQPPTIDGKRIAPADVRYVRYGSGRQAAIVAIAGEFCDGQSSNEILNAVAIRTRIDKWRKHHSGHSAIVTAGGSASARRLRARLQVAQAVRSHVGIFGPVGCSSYSVAVRIHHLSARDEPMVDVDGSLMDAELLDASISPLLDRLTASDSAMATVIVRQLDETPIEAQQRLAELISTFAGRLRMIGLCENTRVIQESDQDGQDIEAELFDDASSYGILDRLADLLSALSVRIDPITKRVEDIPILATAILDSKHALGDGPAERFSRPALDALIVYPWPGNFEELDQTVGHAIRTSPHATIGIEHLPLAVRSYRPASKPNPSNDRRVSLDEAVTRYEARIIREVLEDSGGNRAEAARRLGISRARLLRKLDDNSDSNSKDDDA